MIPFILVGAAYLIAKTTERKSEKYHLGGDMSKHLAPNGLPSKLTHEQWHLVRTPEFKAWFGDWENDALNASKVIDINGEPLVCYHGSRNYFNEFKINEKSKWDIFWFSPNYEAAKMYSEDEYREGVPNIYECFLNVRKISKTYPFDTKKYDGFIDYNIDMDYINWIKIKNIQIVQVVNSNQIKLADGTNTTFDGSKPDIRYDEGGNIDYSNYRTSVIGLFNDGKILILQRGSTANWMPNKWSIVGGVVDEGENPKEAIIRECFEEVGLKPKNVSFDYNLMTNDSGEIYYYHGNLDSNKVKLDYENSNYAFISKSQIDDYDFVPYVKEFIIKLFAKK